MNLKNFSGMLLSVFGLLIPIVVAIVFLSGARWAADRLLGLLTAAGMILLAIDIVILLPLSVVRGLRSLTGGGIFFSSYLFGIATWLLGFAITYNAWGWFGVLLGVMFLGVGVVPLAILACVLHGAWETAAVVVLFAVITFGARLVGYAIGESTSASEQAVRV